MKDSSLYVAPISHSKRLASIDALRGWAAIYVVLVHIYNIPDPNLAIPKWIEPFILSGGSGVTLFFILSAFSLCYTWRLRQGELKPIQSFYIRRFFRIAPLFYFWLALLWLRGAVFYDIYDNSFKLLLSATFSFNLFPGEDQGIVWASWTIGVEMLFYVIFPFLMLQVTNLHQAISFYLITLLVSMGWHHITYSFHLDEPVRVNFVHFSLINHLPNFAMGMLLFYIYERFLKDHERLLHWSKIPILLGAFLYGAWLSDLLNILLNPLYWQGFAYGLIVVGLLIASNRFLVNHLTEFWGEISYSLYLNHPYLIVFMLPLFRRIYELPMLSTLHYGISILVLLPVLSILSFITYKFIERPGMRLGNWVVRRMQS